MSSMVRIAAWLAWPVFAIAVLFLLLLVFLAASLSCTCVDCSSYNASRAGIWKLAMCVEAFQLDCGRLPDQLDELISEVRPEGCAGPWARASDLRDPYGSRFVYRRSADGSSFEVRGIGRDRVYGSADDVTTSDRPWPWLETFWRRPLWDCVIVTLPWFSIPLGPPLWLMAAIVRRIRRTARRCEATATE